MDQPSEGQQGRPSERVLASHGVVDNDVIDPEELSIGGRWNRKATAREDLALQKIRVLVSRQREGLEREEGKGGIDEREEGGDEPHPRAVRDAHSRAR